MDYIFSILAGSVQGLTEFLPISSSGHLILLHEFLNFDLSNNLTFDVVLHLGTLAALVIYFWSDIVKLLSAFFRSFTRRDITDLNQRLAWYLLLSTIPAIVAGVLFEEYIEIFFRNSKWVAIMLIVFGVILYLADRYSSKNKNIFQVTLSDSILIGLAQVLALVPGVSRSGITIIAGLGLKINRADAARFSFLMAIPVVFGAGVKKIYDLFFFTTINFNELVISLLGLITATLVGYLTIKFFLKFLQSHSLKIFAYYRIILGIIILLFNLTNRL